eukprot:gene5516-2152_t
MIQAFGCIDGTHIPMKRPIRNSQDYFNYKQFFSLNIQAVSDANGQFVNVECKWPGSVHDAKVFANSDINVKLYRAQLPLKFSTVLPRFEAVPDDLIGDKAYPLTPFCMKEYQTCASNEDVLFNTMLRFARNQIECAFGRFKARYRKAPLTSGRSFESEQCDLLIEVSSFNCVTSLMTVISSWVVSVHSKKAPVDEREHSSADTDAQVVLPVCCDTEEEPKNEITILKADVDELKESIEFLKEELRM